MSLYIIEDRYGALRDSSVNYKYAKSLQQSKYPDGHIVEMVPAKPKVQVSQEEADMLEQLRTDENASPAGAIRNYFWGSVEGQNDDNKPRWSRENEARLMRAYVNGYTVAKEKKYNVKVPHVYGLYYFKKYDSDQIGADMLEDIDDTPVAEFTAAEIEHYGLQDCEKEEVTDDDD